MNRYLVACVLAVVLAGCKGGKTNASTQGDESWYVDSLEEPSSEEKQTEESLDELIAEEPMPLAAEELFDDFIFNFASNKKLQFERIVFPLVVNSGANVDTIRREDWKMEHFFMHQGEYTLIFDNESEMELVKDTSVSEAMVEKIFLEENFIRQYLFSRQGGRWRLHEVRNQTLPRNPNAPFLEFYHQFVADSVFQRASLSDEIDFVGPDPDDDFSQMEGVITPDFWEAFAPELPQKMLYNVVYGRQDPASLTKIFVIRGISNGLETELTFRQVNGRWKLIKLIE